MAIPMAELDNVEFQLKPVKNTKPQVRRGTPNDRDPNKIGFRILNHTAGVRLSRLIVREWDGRTIAKYDATRPEDRNGGWQHSF